MTGKLAFWLDPRKPHIRALALEAVKKAPEGHVVVVQPPARTADQNRLLWALLTEICTQGFELGGRRLTVDELKEAFVSGWEIANGRGSDIIRGLAGEPLQLKRHTSTMSRPEFSSLIEFIYSECAERGIHLRAEAA